MELVYWILLQLTISAAFVVARVTAIGISTMTAISISAISMLMIIHRLHAQLRLNRRYQLHRQLRQLHQCLHCLPLSFGQQTLRLSLLLLVQPATMIPATAATNTIEVFLFILVNKRFEENS